MITLTSADCKIGVQGRFLKSVCQDNSKTTIKCANSNTIYDITYKKDINATMFSSICENDDKFYQACEKFNGVRVNEAGDDTAFCGRYICHSPKSNNNKSKECSNVDNEDGYCKILVDRDVCLSHENKTCNDVCDSPFKCNDEAYCNGLSYGRFCELSSFYVSLLRISDTSIWADEKKKCHIFDPYPGNPDLFLRNYSGPTCQHSVAKIVLPIFNYTRCAAFQYYPSAVANPEKWWITSTKMPYCTNMMDQTNCTDLERVAFSCLVQGYMTNISRLALCHGKAGVRLCEDGMENICEQLSPSCLVHKHKMCDETADCSDGSDEKSFLCREMTEEKCVRVMANKNLPIPIAWLEDGIVDCLSGEDEKAKWPTCGSGLTKRYVANNDSCTDDYLCLNSKVKFVPLMKLCDRIDTCGNENKVCEIAKGTIKLSTKLSIETEEWSKKSISYCLKGLDNLQNLTQACRDAKFMFPEGQTFGLNNAKIVVTPDQLANCDYNFGESYLFLCCTNSCSSSPCPLSRPLRYDSCAGQFPNRIYTVRDMEHLTFVTPFRGSYQNDYFLCKNLRCITYDKVCDLVDNCGDGSDEEMCTNQFHCNSSSMRIPKWQKCDGKINCEDSSDECNEGCGKEIIEGILLKSFSWIIGSLAVVFNAIIILISSKSVGEAVSGMGLLNKLLIILISVGDLLVGGYLFTISTVDFLYGSSYCSHQAEWLSSQYCSILGIISSTGSQISLFSMTVLSVTRLFGIKNAMNISAELSWKSLLKVIAVLLFIAMLSISIAVSPVVSQYEDFFVNGMSYDKNNLMFLGLPDKNVHVQVIEAYYGRIRGDKTSIGWKKITELVDGMFSKIYSEGLERKKVDFYGNDGVCLFKYFVNNEDPQRLFSWTILAVNFLCFLCISLSYVWINIVSVQSGKAIQNSQITKRNQKMQRKISIIIATDFCCWVPFVVICCLHSLAVFDATPWYALFSIVILPINSVINPLLYDNTISKYFSQAVKGLRQTITTFNSFFSSNRVGIDDRVSGKMSRELKSEG